jgi:hypothetical protein
MSRPRVLVACEYSGIVREAFRAHGWDAWSCDLLPTEIPGQHIEGDVIPHLGDGWDLLIGHPPCTFLCNSSAKHLYRGMKKKNGRKPERWRDMKEGADFFLQLWNAPVPHIAIENPVMVGHAKKLIGVTQAQTIQPWQHGHGETKATCLWLKNLPKLTPTKIVSGRTQRVHKMAPGPNRWKERSRTYPGIAKAMAAQWHNAIVMSEIMN